MYFNFFPTQNLIIKIKLLNLTLIQ